MSDIWELYNRRIDNHGSTKRDAILKNEVRQIRRKIPDNLSFTTVTVYDQAHGYNITDEDMAAGAYKQNVSIINSDNLNEKVLITMPGEDIQQGDLIHWMDNFWIVNERDANTTIYTKVKLLQCNYLLRWVGHDGKIYEQWCVVEDGTKYLTGELEDTRNYVTTRGDSRIAITIARNDITKLFTREDRFLVDDYESPIMMAYTLSKPLKTGLTYSDHGVYKFVLQEVNSTVDDNPELRIADYYKYFPKDPSIDSEPIGTPASERSKWL